MPTDGNDCRRLRLTTVGAPGTSVLVLPGDRYALQGVPTTETLSGNANLTTFAYDADNRLTSQTSLLGTSATASTTTFAYNSAGLLSSQTDALGRVEDFLYDAQDRVTLETWYDAGGTIVYDRLTSTYDMAGDLLTAANSAGSYTMLYDALGEVTGVQEPFGVSLSFAYDALGNRTEVQDYESRHPRRHGDLSVQRHQPAVVDDADPGRDVDGPGSGPGL